MNALAAIAFLLMGMLIGEYYNRRIDKIRREQIDEQRQRRRETAMRIRE